jgi:hypothetical protein
MVKNHRIFKMVEFAIIILVHAKSGKYTRVFSKPLNHLVPA